MPPNTALSASTEKGTIRLPEGTLKELGEYQLDVELHPEVIEKISVTISAEE